MVGIEHTTAAELHEELGSLPLRPIVRVATGASLQEAAGTMRDADVSSALVGEENREIVTERDIARAVALGMAPDEPVEKVAVHIPRWVTKTSHLIDAARIMLRHEVRHIIILDEQGVAVGVISMRDVLTALLPPIGLEPGATPPKG